jgi:hypothetical protein
MQVVGDRPAKIDVVGELRVVAEEVLVIELGMESDESSAEPNPILDVAITVDERLDEGVVRGIVRHRRGNGEPAELIQVVDIDPRADGVARRHIHDVVGRAERLETEVRELECRVAARVDDPGAFGSRDLLAELVS